MNREEILQKSRDAKQDEGFVQAENQGRRMGIVAFVCVFIFILFFSFINGQNTYAPLTMFWAFVAAEAYPKFRFTRNKAYLLTTICASVLTLCYFVCYVVDVVK